MENTFRVGFSRIVMNPDESIPLTGYSNEAKRYNQAITEDICATCVAITDEEDTTVLIVQADFCTMFDAMGENFRTWIHEATGVPMDRIYAAATHTHSAPGVAKDELPCIQRYLEKVKKIVPQCAVEALADRKPAKIATGSIEIPGMNFIKHYKARDNVTGEISYIGDQFGTQVGKTLMEHATQIDPTMHLVKFTREGGKDVVLANWRAHPHFSGGYKKFDLSSDFIGVFREALEFAASCHALYLQGASGNVNSASRFPAERRFTNQRSFGTALAAYAAEGLDKHMTQVPAGKLKTAQLEFHGEINHTMDHLADQAWAFREAWNTTFDWSLYAEEALKLGIRSPYHAGAIKWNSLRNKEEHGKMILNAVSIGDALAFVTFPGEMYDSVSVRMEENSPFKTTLMLGYCHHHIGYLPSAVAYKYTSYETDITRFQAGTGEEVADTYVKMLKELKNQ